MVLVVGLFGYGWLGLMVCSYLVVGFVFGWILDVLLWWVGSYL